MATEPQTEANRFNAQPSTGPRTGDGKARSSQDATKPGLSSRTNCIRPEEQTEYDYLCDALHRRLQPKDPLEEAFSTEIIRATWRLRRCAFAEAARAEATPIDHTQTEQQTSIDRARGQAFGALTRAPPPNFAVSSPNAGSLQKACPKTLTCQTAASRQAARSVPASPPLR
jgi:hypothetical protein